MKSLLLLLISALVLIFGESSWAVNQCYRLYPSTAAISSLDQQPQSDLNEYFKNLMPRSPGKPFHYDDETLDQNFWFHHRRFAFLLSEQQVVLLAKNVFQADLLIKELGESHGLKQTSLTLIQKNQRQTNSLTYFSGIDALQFDVTSLLDAKLLSLLRTKIQRRGPNCWNSCLVYSKILDHIRHSPDYEINFWLHSPLVKKIHAFSQLRLGDILVIKNDQRHEHAFIFVSKNIVLTKNGLSSTAKYRLMDIKEVADIYFDATKSEIEAYRIEDVEGDKEKMHALMPSVYFELLAHTEYFEKQLSDSFRQSSSPVDKNWRRSVIQFVNANVGSVKVFVDQLGGPQAYFDYSVVKPNHDENTQLRLSAWMGLYQRLYALSLPSNN